MKSILLIIGGVIQVLILALHIAIFFGIASAESMGADMKVTAHIFNAAVTVTVFFFAYVSLFRRQDLLGTSFGRIVSWFIAVFYLQRGLVEVFLRGFEFLNIVICVVITALYVIVAWPERKDVIEKLID